MLSGVLSKEALSSKELLSSMSQLLESGELTEEMVCFLGYMLDEENPHRQAITQVFIYRAVKKGPFQKPLGSLFKEELERFEGRKKDFLDQKTDFKETNRGKAKTDSSV